MKRGMSRGSLPSISVLIPTLNAARVLEGCFQSIANQDYPKEKIEIIVADGGSADGTLEIIKKLEIRNWKLEIKIIDNLLKTGEAGKAVALKHAKGELVALIDSDNILPDKNWLKKMTAPFADPEIIGSEPWEFTWRSQDGFIDRYCSLVGMNDPLCYFLGNYDRWNMLTGRWTDLLVEQENKGGWIKVTLKPGAIPTIGANGTILRKDLFSKASQGNTSDGDPLALSEVEGKGLLRSGGIGERKLSQCVKVGDYLFDIDVIAQLASKKPVKFAKVKVGIIHLFCGSDIGKFVRKQKRRVRDYLYYQKIGVRSYPWQKQNKKGLLKFIVSCVTIVPLLYQTIKGYFKKPDPAWFFHPLACWITLGIYGWGIVAGFFHTEQLSRRGWRQ